MEAEAAGRYCGKSDGLQVLSSMPQGGWCHKTKYSWGGGDPTVSMPTPSYDSVHTKIEMLPKKFIIGLPYLHINCLYLSHASRTVFSSILKENSKKSLNIDRSY
jgi:hypothetical protein